MTPPPGLFSVPPTAAPSDLRLTAMTEEEARAAASQPPPGYMSYGPHVGDPSAPAWAYDTQSEGAQGVQLGAARFAQDAAYLTPSGVPDFLASFQAAAFGNRLSLYRAGRSHPLVRAQLRARLDHLVELERLRLSEALLSPAAPGRAVTAVLSQQLGLLCPAQRIGPCPILLVFKYFFSRRLDETCDGRRFVRLSMGNAGTGPTGRGLAVLFTKSESQQSLEAYLWGRAAGSGVWLAKRKLSFTRPVCA